MSLTISFIFILHFTFSPFFSLSIILAHANFWPPSGLPFENTGETVRALNTYTHTYIYICKHTYTRTHSYTLIRSITHSNSPFSSFIYSLTFLCTLSSFSSCQDASGHNVHVKYNNYESGVCSKFFLYSFLHTSFLFPSFLFLWCHPFIAHIYLAIFAIFFSFHRGKVEAVFLARQGPS